MGGKILTVSTSADELNGLRTGLWLEELAAPYYIWKDSGYDVVIGAVGDRIPVDDASLEQDMKGEATVKFLQDESAQKDFKNPVPVKDVKSIDDYDAIYVPGGHGIVGDGPNSPELAALLQKFEEAGKVISSVCHGPAAFTSAKNTKGEPLVLGKKLTGFSNSEEKAVQKEKYVTFLTEDRLKEQHGIYSKGDDWTSYVVTDGTFITGQNPMSSEGVAKAVLSVLKGEKAS
eukprot:jgi/Botrbrau1/1492/Bobra.178_3s0047.1